MCRRIDRSHRRRSPRVIISCTYRLRTGTVSSISEASLSGADFLYVSALSSKEWCDREHFDSALPPTDYGVSHRSMVELRTIRVLISFRYRQTVVSSQSMGGRGSVRSTFLLLLVLAYGSSKSVKPASGKSGIPPRSLSNDSVVLGDMTCSRSMRVLGPT